MSKFKNLRQIYLYLVCFVCIVMILIGAVSTLHGLIDLFMGYEEPYYDIEMDKVQYEEYKNRFKDVDITYDDYVKMKEREKQNRILSDRYYDKKRLAESFSIFIVAIPFYVYHWRKIEKERYEE